MKNCKKAPTKLVAIYQDNLDELLYVGIIYFFEFIKLYSKQVEMSNKNLMLGNLKLQRHIDAEIAFGMHFVIMVINCISEHLFSGLHLNYQLQFTTLTCLGLAYSGTSSRRDLTFYTLLL